VRTVGRGDFNRFEIGMDIDMGHGQAPVRGRARRAS
jgi:hypothetical protein